ncbi:MAG: hypothetical protein KF862_01600 [Chitinophagaceae bacterium]|nr:hypothetical protein [Chitinophagaceae bacterium]
MRLLCTLLFLGFVMSTVNAQKKLFVRVYDLNGKKITQGHVATVGDSALQLNIKKKGSVDLMVGNIGKIKTKRSAGRNIWIGALAGIGAGAVIGGVSGNGSSEDDPTSGLGTAAGILVGALFIGPPLGAAAGGITALFNNPKTFIVNGSVQEWKAFQLYMSEKLTATP